MTDLPNVAPLATPAAPPSDADLRAVLAGLQPGRYVIRDLYPRYLAWAEREGRAAATKIQVGMALRRMGVGTTGHVHGHARAWEITPELAAGE